MESATPRRTLVVANRTAATPLLLDEITRRARERPTSFVLLIPDVPAGKRADWTMEDALPQLERAARGPVEGIIGVADPFESVKRALDEGDYDDVVISTLPKRVSEWLRRDLPRRVQRLGVPVTVISQDEERSSIRDASIRAGGGVGGTGLP